MGHHSPLEVSIEMRAGGTEIAGAELLTSVLAMDPSLAGQEVALLGGGESNIVLLVGGQHVFRFPRTETALTNLKREAALLARLADSAPLPIPRPTHACTEGRLGGVFLGYRVVQGQSFRREDWLSLTATERAQTAADLGRFLRWLHVRAASDAADLPLRRGIAGREHWRDMHAEFTTKLFPLMSGAGREAVSARYAEYQTTGKAGAADGWQALVHGDFGPSNILWDPESRRITGVIDFGSAGLGDPAVDIAALVGPVSYEGIFELLTPSYPEAGALLSRAQYYASTFALQEALYALSARDAGLLERCLASYR